MPGRNNESSGKNTFIFVANLPMNATEETLNEVFQNFRPIKPNGLQVRSFKDNKNCFGFVELESATSVQSADMVLPVRSSALSSFIYFFHKFLASCIHNSTSFRFALHYLWHYVVMSRFRLLLLRLATDKPMLKKSEDQQLWETGMGWL